MLADDKLLEVQVDTPYYSTPTSIVASPTPQIFSRARIADHPCTATRTATGLIRTGTQWTKGSLQIIENRANKRNFRTH